MVVKGWKGMADGRGGEGDGGGWKGMANWKGMEGDGQLTRAFTIPLSGKKKGKPVYI